MFFVVGDVHGKYSLLMELLKNWDRSQQLLFIGDLIDRGEDSRACLYLVKQLVEEEGAICLMGNHEHHFLEWLDNPEENYALYHKIRGDTTINSLLNRPLDTPVDHVIAARQLSEDCADMISFLRSLPYYHETDTHIFVHAGLDWQLDDWRQTSEHDLVWLREDFYNGQNMTDKTIIFGHKPTSHLFNHGKQTSELWITDDNKIGIDGGAVYGGVLHGLVVNANGIKDNYYVSDSVFMS